MEIAAVACRLAANLEHAELALIETACDLRWPSSRRGPSVCRQTAPGAPETHFTMPCKGQARADRR